MPPINQLTVNKRQNNHGNRHSTQSNGHTKSSEVDSVSGLKITASLRDSQQMRRNLATDAGGSITVSPKPGDSPTTHTVFKDEEGKLQVVDSNPNNTSLQNSVRGQGENILGSITVADVSDARGEVKPGNPTRPIPQFETYKITVENYLKSKPNIETFQVQKNFTVDKLKTMIAGREGIPKENQRLNCAGKNLLDINKTLEDYNIKEGSKIFLTGNYRGG